IPTDGHAAAVFAIIPAAAFNIIREEALAGNVVFPGIVLRDSPNPKAVLDDGSLSYDVLVEGGFTYGMGVDVILNPVSDMPVGAGLGLGIADLSFDDGDRLAKKRKIKRFFRRGLLRRIVQGIVKVVKEVVQVVREIASATRQLFAGSREISLAIKFGNVVSTE